MFEGDIAFASIHDELYFLPLQSFVICVNDILYYCLGK